MAVDPETVVLMSTYRVGFLPPKPESLAPGELYIEIGSDAPRPRLWVGMLKGGGPAGDLTLLVPDLAGIPPISLATPYVSQDGANLSCTMGTWTGEPDTYAYQWQLDGNNAGADANLYVITVPDDVGKTATCILSATNANGTGTAEPSNPVIITEPPA